MNRAQRRANQRARDKMVRREINKGLTVVDGVPKDKGFHVGDKFTISGYRRKPDGTMQIDCAPGDESVFIVGSLEE